MIGFVRFCGHLKEGIESFPMMLRPHESDAWMPSYCVSKFRQKIWIIVLAEINEIYCALLRQSRVRFLASSRHFPVTFPSLSSNFRGPGLVVSWLENQRCDDIIMAGPFDCRMRHEVPNLQSIYLLKMCCNPFTHF